MSLPPSEPQVFPAPVAEPEVSSDFSSFYRATLRPLRDYLARVLGNRTEAQDIAQDAYLKTYQAMNDQPVRRPQAFLFTTARRLAFNFRKRRGNRMIPTEAVVLEFQAGATSHLVDDVIARQEAAAFEAALVALPAGCQQVLLLQLRDGLSHAEIAARLDISPSTVANHLTRALRLLREHIPDAKPRASGKKTASSR